jgi:hypothetical protein
LRCGEASEFFFSVQCPADPQGWRGLTELVLLPVIGLMVRQSFRSGLPSPFNHAASPLLPEGSGGLAVFADKCFITELGGNATFTLAVGVVRCA